MRAKLAFQSEYRDGKGRPVDGMLDVLRDPIDALTETAQQATLDKLIAEDVHVALVMRDELADLNSRLDPGDPRFSLQTLQNRARRTIKREEEDYVANPETYRYELLYEQVGYAAELIAQMSVSPPDVGKETHRVFDRVVRRAPDAHAQQVLRTIAQQALVSPPLPTVTDLRP